MYRIILGCYGVPPTFGALAESKVSAHFRDHKTCHENVECTWDGEGILLQADNDFGVDALRDEFAQCLLAFLPESVTFVITVESIAELPLGSS